MDVDRWAHLLTRPLILSNSVAKVYQRRPLASFFSGHACIFTRIPQHMSPSYTPETSCITIMF